MSGEKRSVGCRFSSDVSDQAVLVYDGDGGENTREFHQDGVDLAEFQALSAKLHLKIGTPEILDLTTGIPHDEVTGAVQAPSAERVGHKAICSQIRTIHVATGELHSREIQLSRNSYRAGRQALIQHVGSSVPDRSTDRHRARCRGIRLVERHVHGSFGGTVEIVQICTDSFVEATHRRTRKCLTACEHPSNGLELRDISVDEKDVEHRRDEVQGGDTFTSDQLRQVTRIAVSVGFGYDQPRTGDERPEQLPHRNVEGGRRLVQHDIPRRERVLMLHPQQAIDYRTMRDCNTFGFPGGPGREHHVGNVIRRYVTGTVDVLDPVGGVPRKIDLVEKHRLDLRRQRCGIGRHRQHYRWCSYVEHMPDPLTWVFRIDRKIRSTCGDDGVDRDHVMRTSLQRDRNERLGPDPTVDEVASKRVDLGTEFTVADRRVSEGHCSTGHVGDVSVGKDQIEQRRIDHRVGSVVPLVEHEPTFGIVERVDVPDADTLVGHRSEYRCETSPQTHRGVVVHCVGCVLDGETEARFEDGDQRQRVMSRVCDLDTRDAHPGDVRRGFERRTIHGIRLEHRQRVEHRAGAHRRLHLGKTDVMAVEQPDLLGLNLFEQFGNRTVRVHADANGDGVDEQAENVFDPGQRRGSTGDGGAEHDVVTPEHSTQQQAPCCLDDGVDRDPGALGQRDDGLGRRGFQRDVDVHGNCVHGGFGAVRCDQRRFVRPRQRAGPPFQCLAVVLFGQPVQIRAVRPSRSRERCVGGVERK
ncbi:hypothetical protein BKP42_20610 [Rhodococcus erythropolis]|nr:hypothetical protein BKP42_20610 [Rhodococcus erythropolis]